MKTENGTEITPTDAARKVVHELGCLRAMDIDTDDLASVIHMKRLTEKQDETIRRHVANTVARVEKLLKVRKS